MTDSATIAEIIKEAEKPLCWRVIALRYEKRYGIRLSFNYVRERIYWLKRRGYITMVSRGKYEWENKQ